MSYCDDRLRALRTLEPPEEYRLESLVLVAIIARWEPLLLNVHHHILWLQHTEKSSWNGTGSLHPTGYLHGP